MAPEVLQTGSLSMAADVYSFAMIMIELWTGKTIYKDFPAHQVTCEAHPVSAAPECLRNDKSWQASCLMPRLEALALAAAPS